MVKLPKCGGPTVIVPFILPWPSNSREVDGHPYQPWHMWAELWGFAIPLHAKGFPDDGFCRGRLPGIAEVIDLPAAMQMT